MENVILGISLLLCLASAGLVVYTRKSLVMYTDQLMECLEAVLAGKKDIDFQENQETLTGKLQMKLHQIYENMEKTTEESICQRKQLEAIVSDISHQVKTPVASIRMYYNFLERNNLGKEKRGEFLCAMGHQVDKLEFLMGSMIHLSRLETGIVNVQQVKNSVYDLVAQAVCGVALKAEEKNINIEVFCPQELTACFDMKWTVEALFNILDNGVKYTDKEEGKIEITVGKTDYFVRIDVKDNGRGIPESRIFEVFKRFYREPESADTEGIGIGLYLAREIVMKQNGYIEMHSAPGRGTKVSIHLPVM